MDISLNGKWKLYFYDSTEKEINHPSELTLTESIDATVPGNCELDLCESGILPKDIFKGENILLGEKYETYEWWYETSFDKVEYKNGERVILNFEGVDTLATYYLNGEVIGESDNMFISHQFDITDKMKDKNTLFVKIKSAILEELALESNVYIMSNYQRAYDYRAQIRKAPHQYGWDIMPRAVSAGIWRDVIIKVMPQCYFNQTYIVTDKIQDGKATLQYMYDIKLPKEYYGKNLTLKINGKCEDSEFEVKKRISYKSGHIMIDVDNAKLWWPYGYGEAKLYDVTSNLYLDDTLIASDTKTLGIRTVNLYRKDILDEKENSFRFIINGEDIVCKGSNWVPLDAYHSQDSKRYEKALNLVKDIGCNILRCWGGNVYEDTYFYDFCDKNGIMVWQDFAMACLLYPQTEEFFSKIKKEAESVIKKLRQHPSIILWSGDNECDMICKHETSYNPNIANKITRKIIPDVIMSHDKCRPYLQSSPYICDELFKARRFDLVSEDHLWGVRDFYKADFYKNHKAHFVSETGYHGSPCAKSVKKFIDEEFLWPPQNNKEWILHSSDQNGDSARVNLMIDQIRQLFGISLDNLEDFCLASQFSQAEAKKFFIERVRVQTPRTGGIIWWNLLDGWPQFSDAIVDYYFEKKLAYYYVKQSQAPFSIIIGELKEGHLPIYVVNDTLEAKCGNFEIIDADTSEVVYKGSYDVSKNTFKNVGKIKADYSEKRMLIIKWDNGCNHYLSGSVPFDFEKYKKWNEILMKEYTK